MSRRNRDGRDKSIDIAADCSNAEVAMVEAEQFQFGPAQVDRLFRVFGGQELDREARDPVAAANRLYLLSPSGYLCVHSPSYPIHQEACQRVAISPSFGA
jgi:hypothetical protein